jgi:AcrR family transcriptional regulator
MYKESGMKKPIAAQQARSRESLQRLLQAAADVLQEEGLEGATIPRISVRAGLTPGAVYRRFPDKDALMQTVVLTIMQSNDAGVAGLLKPEKAAGLTLEKTVDEILHETVKSYRRYSRLLSAVAQYFRSHPDMAFKKKVDVIETRTFLRVVAYLLYFRQEILHPDPERAVAFAFSVAGHSLREILLMEAMTDVWTPILPRSDEELVEELSAMMLAYLRSSGPPHRKTRKRGGLFAGMPFGAFTPPKR